MNARQEVENVKRLIKKIAVVAPPALAKPLRDLEHSMSALESAVRQLQNDCDDFEREAQQARH